jgi:hypothetical protein
MLFAKIDLYTTETKKQQEGFLTPVKIKKYSHIGYRTIVLMVDEMGHIFSITLKTLVQT